jgi:hypothetical protein
LEVTPTLFTLELLCLFHYTAVTLPNKLQRSILQQAVKAQQGIITPAVMDFALLE